MSRNITRSPPASTPWTPASSLRISPLTSGPGSIDMRLGPATRPVTQPQVRTAQPAGIAGTAS